MKSSQMKVENQRIERITPSTLVVGIDIAKDKHVAQATNFRGMALTKRAVMVDNDQNGFEQLERTIRHLQKIHGMNDVIVGMESTGHYWFNIANWLVEQGVDVVLVNPLTTKRNKENRDNSPSKSDPKDALVIADVVSRGYYTLFTPSEEIFQRLRTMVKNREFWVKESTRFKNQIIRWLDIHFPEYTVVFKPKKLFTTRSLATLRAYPSPTDLKDLQPENLISVWQEHMSRPGGKRGMRKATQLIQVAQRSIGTTVGLTENKSQLRYLLDAYEWVRKTIDEVDQEIERILPQVPCSDLVLSVGVTSTSTAVILSCAGDLRELDHGNQLLRKAGLNLAERSSGKYKGKVKITKRGNSLLRKHLYLAVTQMLSYHSAFQRLHEENVSVKRMTKMQSIMKLIGKMARMLVAMARDAQPFMEEKLQPTAA